MNEAFGRDHRERCRIGGTIGRGRWFVLSSREAPARPAAAEIALCRNVRREPMVSFGRLSEFAGRRLTASQLSAWENYELDF
jgi:hypothetical protein